MGGKSGMPSLVLKLNLFIPRERVVSMATASWRREKEKFKDPGQVIGQSMVWSFGTIRANGRRDSSDDAFPDGGMARLPCACCSVQWQRVGAVAVHCNLPHSHIPCARPVVADL